MEKKGNPFEEEAIAKEWINAIENERGGSRELEIYPILNDWSKGVVGNILEVGSGQGICSESIDITQREYIGVEPSSILVERAKELFEQPNRKFVLGNAYNLPLENESVGGAFSVGVWFHLADLDRAHTELSRVLKPGGQILVFTSNPETYNTWETWFENPIKLGKRIEGAVLLPNGKLSRNLFYLHSEKDIIDSMKKAGLTISLVSKLGKVFEKEGIWMLIKAGKSSSNVLHPSTRA